MYQSDAAYKKCSVKEKLICRDQEKDIFNMIESGLFFKITPDKTPCL